MIDIHVVSNEVPYRFSRHLGQLGFTEVNVVGGDPRVRMKHLFSTKISELSCADALFEAACAACAAEDFCGYIEQEVVTDDIAIRPTHNTSSLTSLGIMMEVTPCPPWLHKGCDIHATASCVDDTVHDAFSRAGFYYLALNKPNIGEVIVFTIQLENARQGRQVWDRLSIYLKQSQGFKGYLKFEVTRNFCRFGNFSLPPLVLAKTPPIISAHSDLRPGFNRG